MYVNKGQRYTVKLGDERMLHCEALETGHINLPAVMVRFTPWEHGRY